VLPTLPDRGWKVRSADHVRWVTAGEAALGWEPRSYEALILGENERAQENALDALPWVKPLRRLLSLQGGEWTGTMGDLLDELKALATPVGERLDSFGWPKTGKGMSDAARRAKPGLAVVGIHYGTAPRRNDTGARYTWVVKVVKAPPPTGGGGDGEKVVKVVKVPPASIRGEDERGKEEEEEEEGSVPLTYRDEPPQPSQPSSCPCSSPLLYGRCGNAKRHREWVAREAAWQAPPEPDVWDSDDYPSSAWDGED
jgi:hypothetical protein